jgi:hypothetical protein
LAVSFGFRDDDGDAGGSGNRLILAKAGEANSGGIPASLGEDHTFISGVHPIYPVVPDTYAKIVRNFQYQC